MRLKGDDKVIALAILRHLEVTTEERTAYLSESRARRLAEGSEPEVSEPRRHRK